MLKLDIVSCAVEANRHGTYICHTALNSPNVLACMMPAGQHYALRVPSFHRFTRQRGVPMTTLSEVVSLVLWQDVA